MTGKKANGLRVLEREECIDLLETTPIGRVGFISDDGPLVLPVNYHWHDGGIVFRTHAGQKLEAAVNQEKVCFEVDRWSSHPRSGASVVVMGAAREVTDWAEKEILENIGLIPWTRDAWRRLWVRIEPSEITGRELA